jgi:biopolymer transport protein ExbD
MGASALPGGDGAEEGDDIVAEINVTPLTDIFLVLLIIFMVTSTVIVEEGKNIDLPDAEVAEDTAPKGVTVSMNAEGAILINDTLAEPGSVQKLLELALADAEDKIVILRGDSRVLLGSAVNVLDLAQKAGAKGIALSTEQPREAQPIQ